ncbi:MAG: hypothetical protein GX969_03270 [Firmicutes bacterium]|nr:hypothetical protein [Bacillota bacterium]
MLTVRVTAESSICPGLKHLGWFGITEKGHTYKDWIWPGNSISEFTDVL